MAKLEGVKVEYVNPEYSSQRCSCCGERVSRTKDFIAKSYFQNIGVFLILDIIYYITIRSRYVNYLRRFIVQ
ncbi:hypothetical protein CDQ84_13550 [Clostridium thermosuccinogenes]|uniref:Cas12f1-like TNB domain-containing protein n=1 Tax=Clostridium thermosuccinogenes TaxID=84032 RepID=A0A2K2F018_9CLOT|nr:zinc ribbon domain-containing protein [Pseudoclostridium thermosuccinogenes]AUS97208.1 hypothetical protein CDO33_12620 [Pseudoclostridium thermosuccinogenes]PNT92123.1 hypothetical protein CDQ83_00640 [Pseudoclostridium thermosuccinogenes]PNT95951.1 hypothetical protein CDQ85_13420 [Pseudoclostridium thermosuccinogenes]PNT97339.1 hypothetical protein CDQ84_13550 [Pseudoclostridium thermosuccinogenes]